MGSAVAHWRVQWGSTALIHAAHNGCADCARLLLDAGADKNATSDVRASRFACGLIVWGFVDEMVCVEAHHFHFWFTFCFRNLCTIRHNFVILMRLIESLRRANVEFTCYFYFCVRASLYLGMMTIGSLLRKHAIYL